MDETSADRPCAGRIGLREHGSFACRMRSVIIETIIDDRR